MLRQILVAVVIGQTALFSAAASAAPASQQAPPPLKGDFILITALRNANLTDDQLFKVAPVMEAGDKDMQSLLKERQTAPLLKELTDTVAAVKAAGGNPGRDPKVQELQKKFAEFLQTNQKDFDKQEADIRNKTMAEILPLLGEEQQRIVKLRVLQRTAIHDARGAGFPDGFLPGMEEEYLLAWARGIDLSPEQHDKAIAALKPLLDKYKDFMKEKGNLITQLPEDLRKNLASPEAQKAMAELADKRHVEMKPMLENIRLAVEAVLTPEQKAQVVRNREAQTKPSVQTIVDRAVAEIEKGGLTDQQKQKAKELADAARDAMLKLDPEDWGAPPFSKIYRKLTDDLHQLLTEEQKAKLKELNAPAMPGNP